MNRADAYLALTEIFRHIFQDDTMVLRPGTTASDVAGWDSFKQVEILLAAQERFGFRLRSRDIDAVHCVGDLVLQGEHFDVDCYVPRDRSWSQVRTEKQGATVIPPIGWSPMYFGKDLIFNSIGYEDPDTDPAWSGLFDLPPDRPSHNFGWISVDGQVRGLNHVRRDVAARHHALGAPVEQTIEAEDDHGRIHRFSGKAIAMSAVPFWPNASFRDSLFRWEAEDGRVAHQTFQEIWFDTVERRLLERATLSGAR